MKQYIIGALYAILGIAIIGSSYFKGFKKGADMAVRLANEKIDEANEKIAEYVKES